MTAGDRLKSISKKLLISIISIVALLTIAFLIWKKKKYNYVQNKIATTVAKKTDSLYKVTYDSIHFDALTGQAFIQNIHIGPDSNIVKKRKLDELPFLLVDVRISSIKINGVQADKAILGQQIVGDSVVIDKPDINIYFLKHLQKNTKIETEAGTVYDEILGNLTLIKMNHILINNVHINGYDFFSKEKEFEMDNGKVQLTNVLVDSAHNLDTSRTLFCRQIALQIPSFITYNNTRPAIRVGQLNYSGADNLLSFKDIQVNRFESDNGDSTKFLHATGLYVKGMDANEIVKNKNLLADTIECKSVLIYQPRVKDLVKTSDTLHKVTDSTGFMRVYSVAIKQLSFPKITFIPVDNQITIGNISFFINNIKADEVNYIKTQPLKYSKAAQLNCDNVFIKSSDGLYTYDFKKMGINSLRKELKISSIAIRPKLSEKAFANKANFQKDRYDLALSGILLKGINMQNLLDNKIVATDLIINTTSGKIYRDLNKPVNGKSKVGNYPSQMLMKLKVPVAIDHAEMPNTFIQYTEHEKLTDSSGVITFNDAKITIDNITNEPGAIKKNNAMTIAFDTKALNAIPLTGYFKFFLNSDHGEFAVMGHISKFDALVLNKVSVPMALIRLKQGTINSIDFNFTGDDHAASGDFVMKYDGVKVDVLKIDKDSRDISKKGLFTFLANTIVKNNNPNNGNLRTEKPSFNRDDQKSFFNLVWKTIFKGMKKTMGVP